MTKLYIVRHGETEWNKLSRTQGCGNDLSLSQSGKLQAEAIANRFKNIPIDAIYSSDLKRAYDTALEISKVISIPVNITTDFREMNFGCWEGLTTDEIKSTYKETFEIWKADPKEVVIPDGETLISLQNRVINKVNEIIKQHTGKNIIIVSHGISIKMLILSILCMDISYLSRVRISNTGLSIIEYGDEPVLTLFNDTCHLT